MDGLIPYDQTWVGSGVRPYYRSYEDAAIQPGPLAGWTPVRTVTFNSRAQLTAALTGITDGDYIVYNGVGVLTLNSASDQGLNVTAKSVATKAVIDFGNYYHANHVKMSSTSTSLFYGAWFQGQTNVWWVGGEYTSLKTGGIRWDGGSGSGIWGAVSHGNGGHGAVLWMSATQTTMSNCMFNYESFGNNQNPGGDPHGDGGGGWHGGLVADSNVSNSTLTGSTFIVYDHDTDYGSGIQFGDATGTNIALSNNLFYLKTENNQYVGTSAPDDSAIGFTAWGSGVMTSNFVELLEVRNYAGRATYCDSLTYALGSLGMTVKHGRAVKTNLNTTFLAAHDPTLGATIAFDTRKPTRMTHQDCIQSS